MSRRRHHNNYGQPYDNNRFNDFPRDRPPARGIQYQDDSRSDPSSEEENYLHSRFMKDKKEVNKPGQNNSAKLGKPDKPPNNEPYHTKEVKPLISHPPQHHPTGHPPPHHQTGHPSQHHATGHQPLHHPPPLHPTGHPPPHHTNVDTTSERLGRLEKLLEDFIKKTPTAAPAPANSFQEKPSDGRFYLDPRKHDFTTSMWINSVQQVSMQNHWSEKSTLQYVGTQMSGIIKTWYNSLPNYDLTWPELKLLITKMFPDNTDFITTLKRLVTRLKQPNETMTNYYYGKMYLVEACKISGEDAVSCLIDGLNNQEIQEKAKAQNFLTPETLFSQCLVKLPDYKVDYCPIGAPETEAALNNWYYPGPGASAEAPIEVSPPEESSFEYKEAEEVEFEARPNSGFPRPQPVKFEPPPRKRPAPVHARLDRRFMRGTNAKPVPYKGPPLKICAICNMRGHLARNCRNANQMQLCKVSSQKWRDCFNKSCAINGSKFEALVDTGCSTVTIQESVAAILNLAVHSTSDVMIGFGGNVTKAVGEAFVSIQVDEVESQLRAVIVPDYAQEASVIVGQSFLDQENVRVVLQDHKLKIFEKSRENILN